MLLLIRLSFSVFILSVTASNAWNLNLLSTKKTGLQKKVYHMRPYRHIVEYDDVSDLSIYYNSDTNQKLRNVMPRPWYRPGWPLRIPFEGGKCLCNELKCDCCTIIDIKQFRFKRKACAIFNYNPNELTVDMDVTMNGTKIFYTKFSATNPPPFCIPIAVPYLPPGFVDFCIQLFDIRIEGQKLHVCMDMETRIDKAPILVLHFDCMLMGLEGVSVVKPSSGVDTQNATVTNGDPSMAPADPDTDSEATQPASDIYDVVEESRINATILNKF